MILHVMNYHEKDVDYMVGAQLEGFDTMVKITNDNDFMVIEGDEYLSSPIDRRPKFHLYTPNIPLLSGITWDHVNVFPTYENYVDQFEIFLNEITNGGARSEEHTSELQSRPHLVCRLLLEKKKDQYLQPDLSISSLRYAFTHVR